ncbi:MAG TPA: hypothetical protein VMU47_22990 [Caldimonas sp.]|nr:hypothetical protein [Caldimonas sp.]
MTPYRVFMFVVLCIVALTDALAHRYLSARLSNAVGIATFVLWILTLVGSFGSVGSRPRRR